MANIDNDDQSAQNWKQLNTTSITNILLQSQSPIDLYESIKLCLINAINTVYGTSTDERYIKIVNLILSRFRNIIDNLNTQLVDVKASLDIFNTTIENEFNTIKHNINNTLTFNPVQILNIINLGLNRIKNSKCINTILLNDVNVQENTDITEHSEINNKINVLINNSTAIITSISSNVIDTIEKLQLNLQIKTKPADKRSNKKHTDKNSDNNKKDDSDNSDIKSLTAIEKKLAASITTPILKFIYNKTNKHIEKLKKRVKELDKKINTLQDHFLKRFERMLILLNPSFLSQLLDKLFGKLLIKLIMGKIKTLIFSIFPINFSKLIERIKNFFDAIGKTVKQLWKSFKSVLKSILKGAFKILKTIFSVVLKIAKTVVKPFISLFKVAVRAMFATFKAIIRGIVRLTKLIARAIKRIVATLVRYIKSFIQFLGNKIKNFLKHFDKIKKKLLEFFKKIGEKLRKFKDKLKNIFNALKNKLKIIFNKIRNKIKTVITKIKNVIVKVFKKIKSVIKTVFKKIFQSVKRFIKKLVDKIVRPIVKYITKKITKKAAKTVGKSVVKKVIKTIVKKVFVALAKFIAGALALNILPGPGTVLSVVIIIARILIWFATDGYEIYKIYKELSDAAKAFGMSVPEFLKMYVWEEVVNWMKGVWEKLKNLGKLIWDKIKEALAAAGKAVVDGLKSVVGVFKWLTSGETRELKRIKDSKRDAIRQKVEETWRWQLNRPPADRRKDNIWWYENQSSKVWELISQITTDLRNMEDEQDSWWPDDDLINDVLTRSCDKIYQIYYWLSSMGLFFPLNTDLFSIDYLRLLASKMKAHREELRKADLVPIRVTSDKVQFNEEEFRFYVKKLNECDVKAATQINEIKTNLSSTHVVITNLSKTDEYKNILSSYTHVYNQRSLRPIRIDSDLIS